MPLYLKKYKAVKAFFHLWIMSLQVGDRAATLLFFLSTPAAGGATVFPYLGISVRLSATVARMLMRSHLPS